MRLILLSGGQASLIVERLAMIFKPQGPHAASYAVAMDDSEF